MRATSQLDILDACLTAHGVRDYMVELEKPGFGAASFSAGKRAPSVIALPHRASNRGWNAARMHRQGALLARTRSLSTARAFEVLQQQRDRAIDDFRRVPGRYRVPEKRLRPAEAFEGGLAKTVDWYLANEAWVADVTSGAYREWVARQYG